MKKDENAKTKRKEKTIYYQIFLSINKLFENVKQVGGMEEGKQTGSSIIISCSLKLGG